MNEKLETGEILSKQNRQGSKKVRGEAAGPEDHLQFPIWVTKRVVELTEIRKSAGARQTENMLSIMSEAETEVLAGYPHGNVKQLNPRVLISSNSEDK